MSDWLQKHGFFLEFMMLPSKTITQFGNFYTWKGFTKGRFSSSWDIVFEEYIESWKIILIAYFNSVFVLDFPFQACVFSYSWNFFPK